MYSHQTRAHDGSNVKANTDLGLCWAAYYHLLQLRATRNATNKQAFSLRSARRDSIASVSRLTPDSRGQDLEGAQPILGGTRAVCA